MYGAGSYPTLLVGFRWTWRQALARGLQLGAFLALAVIAVALAAVGVPRLVDRLASGGGGSVNLPPLAWVAIIVVPLLLGAAIGLARGRHIGADVDDLGIHQVPSAPRSFAPWQRIADIRAERRRRRTVVSVYLDSGAMLRLRAPYDGPLLAHDPLFEQKMFNLRNLWETHRRWDLHH
jgi:hypothetical protein